MRAAVVTTAPGFEIVDLPDPTPGPDELVLRVGACGICGSDLKMHEHMPAGMVMGHEFAGEVVATGRAVGERFRVGQLACALPLIGCGSCVPCVTGDVVHCLSGTDMIGVGGSAGAYAEYVRVAATETFVLPDGVSVDLGAMVEPIAVGLHAVRKAGLQPGDDVLVLGAGPVGLAVTLWARHFGAREIVVSDPVGHRRATATTIGASLAVDPAANPGEVMRDRTGQLADVTFECVGTPGMLGAAIDTTADHGRVIVAGVCVAPDTFVPVLALMKELTMQFSVYYGRDDFGYTLDMLGSGRIDPRPFITDHVDLDGFPAAFAALKKPSTQSKVLVHP